MKWRTGRKVHRTIYLEGPDGDALIGVMDTPELATLAAAAPELLQALELALFALGGSSDQSEGRKHTIGVIRAAILKAGGSEE